MSFVILFHVELFIFLLSSEIFVYSWSVSFMSCIIWKYFLCVACLFMLLISFKGSSFNFDNVQFFSYIINHGFVVTTMFLSGCFIVLGFTFNLRMHLKNCILWEVYIKDGKESLWMLGISIPSLWALWYTHFLYDSSHFWVSKCISFKSEDTRRKNTLNLLSIPWYFEFDCSFHVCLLFTFKCPHGVSPCI